MIPDLDLRAAEEDLRALAARNHLLTDLYDDAAYALAHLRAVTQTAATALDDGTPPATVAHGLRQALHTTHSKPHP